MNFIGVDLTPITASAYEPTAFCVLKKDGKGLPVLAECMSVPERDGKASRLWAEAYAPGVGSGERLDLVGRFVTRADEELVSLIIEFMPGIVAFDTPLSIPDGRAGYDLRLADRILTQDPQLRDFRKTLRARATLTGRTCRALAIRELLDREGLVYGEDFIEVCPQSSLVYLSLPAEFKDGRMIREDLPDKLLRQLRIPPETRLPQNGREYAALVSAFTGYLRYIGVTEEVGDPGEGTITLARRADHAGSH
ncbi:MAG TPA: hypothetical protein VGL40_12765 [Bacillota bacterium]|jgi:predicted nuclease with RNAse H fold